MNRNNQRAFYFPLFRLIAMLRGGSAARAESNAVEAWLTGLMVYLIHYLFFATLFIPSNFEPWKTGLFLVALAFWVWLFWLLFLYLNSVIIRVLHRCGLFRAIPTRRLQSILWGILTTAMAWDLLDASPAPREVGAIWLVAVAMNLAAMMVLAFSDGARVAGK
jgi:CDP-diglyceride synthetase